MGVEILTRETVSRAANEILPTETLTAVLEKLLSVLEISDRELSVLLTDDEEIQRLNQFYRGKNRPTDVLSFSLREGEDDTFAEDLLGDVAISIETTLRQAAQLEVTPPEELLRLAIHGTLHLMGFEHENVSDDIAAKMRQKEEELFEMLSAQL